MPLKTALVVTIVTCSVHADWREDLLEQRGIGLDEVSLQKASQQVRHGNKAIEQAFAHLASDEFKEREQGQLILSEAGEAVLDFLDSKQPIDDPEVRARVGDIRKAVVSGVKTRMGPILRHAAKSLLEQPKGPSTGGLFFEWFSTDQDNCFGGYRALTHEGDRTQKPFVKDGRLHIPGNHDGEEDQRLSLKVGDWPGGKQLPDRFQVSCLMGGEDGGAGIWHLALCVGKVKALIHPGYDGGAFRFEQIETLEKYSDNKDMGFTPQIGKLHRMHMDVFRLPSGQVQIKVQVTASEGEMFESEIQMESEQIGPLDRISLERSGMRGGNAVFDDLLVKVTP